MERWAIFGVSNLVFRNVSAFIFAKKSVRIDLEFHARLYGTRLPHIKEHWYLGVWFDESLTICGRQIHKSVS